MPEAKQKQVQRDYKAETLPKNTDIRPLTHQNIKFQDGINLETK